MRFLPTIRFNFNGDGACSEDSASVHTRIRNRFGASSYDLASADKIPVIRTLIAGDEEGLALDIGSGTGFTTYSVFAGRTTVCVDLCSSNLQFGRNQMAAISKDHSPGCFQALATELPFKDGVFRFILCSEVLEHLEEDHHAVAEISRVLADDGTTVLTVPYTGIGYPGLLEFLHVKTVHDYPGPEFHVRPGYDENSLGALLSAHGLEIIERRYYLRFATKMTVDVLALIHLLYQRLRWGRKSWTWAEAAQLDSSVLLRLYKLAFPLLRLSTKFDRAFGQRGFGLIVKVQKRNDIGTHVLPRPGSLRGIAAPGISIIANRHDE